MGIRLGKVANIIVRPVIAGQPALQLRTGVLQPRRIDLVSMIRVAGKFDDHPVGIDSIDGSAIAMVEHIGRGFDQACRCNPPLKFGLDRKSVV